MIERVHTATLGWPRRLAFAVLLLGWLAGNPAPAAARAHPVLAGSSTVFPFAAAVAERQPRPGALVLPIGTGAGLAWFCEGLGSAAPDIALASRAMLPEEIEACRAVGVTTVEERLLGYDGIVLAMAPGAALRELSPDALWRALAVTVPDPAGGEAWVTNPYRNWRELDGRLPDLPIRVLGPPATSGTRDALVRLALRPACEAALGARSWSGFDARRCGEMRRDGVWVDAGENDDALAARLQADPAAMGVLGYGVLRRHPDRLAAVCLDGRCPSAASIAAGDYPLARPLFLYLKPARLAAVPGLEPLVAGFFSPAASGTDGYLVRLGLVPAAAAGVAVRPLDGTPAAAAPPEHDALRWITALAMVLVLVAVLLGLGLVRRAVPARPALERGVTATLWSAAALSGALLAVVLATLIIPTVSFFRQVSPRAFLGGTHWSPESAIRASQVVGEGAFGVLPVLLGSVLVAMIALALALPLALAAALHGYAWAGSRFRRAWRLGARVAALVPAVVYGLFAALTVGPAIAAAAAALGVQAAVESVLAAGLVVGIMLLPALALRIGEALDALPMAAAESAIGLGATRWETLRDIVLPAAAPGIGAALLLAVTRALGETVVVLMAAGLVAYWGPGLLDSGTTLTVQMVALMSGTHELDNVRTQLPFVLGLFLAMIVLPLNAWALRLLRRSDVTPSPVL